VVGALLLAACVGLTLQARRLSLRPDPGLLLASASGKVAV